MRRYYPQLIIALVLGVLTAVTFGPALHADFVQWDDDINIYRNPHLGPLTLDRLAWMFGDLKYQWRYQPLTFVTWSLVYQVFGLDPFGYHLINLVFHFLNGVLAYLVIRKLLWLVKPQSDPIATHVAAALGGALWLLHPLRVESVVWATELLYCQAMFFLLLSLFLYLRSRGPTDGSIRRGVSFWAAVVCFAGSLLSFPLAFGFVAVLVVADIYPLRRLGQGPGGWWHAAALRVWGEKIPFVVVTLAGFAATWYCRTHVVASWSKPVSVEEFGIAARVMQAFYLWAYYLWKPWAPFDLSPVYTQLVKFSPTDAPFVAGMVLVLAVSAGLFAMRRRWPAGLALWVCHLAMLVPMLGLTEHPHFPGDRYSIIVTLSWSILLGAGLLKIWPSASWRKPALAAAVLCISGLAWMSWKQVHIWQNSVTLFEYALQKLGNDPYRADLRYRLGKVHLDLQDFPRAVENLSGALKLRPESPLAHLHLGQALLHLGRLDEALAHAREALRLSPQLEDAHNLAGIVLAEQGKAAEAAAEFTAELAVRPRQANAFLNRARVQAKLGKLEPALADFTEAMRLAPGDFSNGQQALFFQALAAGYFQAGRAPEAVKLAQKAAQLADTPRPTDLGRMIREELKRYESPQGRGSPQQ